MFEPSSTTVDNHGHASTGHYPAPRGAGSADVRDWIEDDLLDAETRPTHELAELFEARSKEAMWEGHEISHEELATTEDFSSEYTEKRPEPLKIELLRFLQVGPILDKLSEARKLPDDWDGDGGYAPPKITIDAAFHFLLTFAAKLPKQIPVPEFYVVGDGEVGFAWRGQRAEAIVAFFDDGEIAITANAQGVDRIHDVFGALESIPWHRLSRILSRLR